MYTYLNDGWKCQSENQHILRSFARSSWSPVNDTLTPEVLGSPFAWYVSIPITSDVFVFGRLMQVGTITSTVPLALR